MERGRRLVLFLVTVSFMLSFIWKGHGESRNGKPVAFLPYSTAGVTVRLKGAVPVPGVYRFCDGATVVTVMNMTAPQVAAKLTDNKILNVRLYNGDVLEVISKGRQHVEITINKMKAKEQMILGIPLHPDAMDLADWDGLPGIGPGLAKSILDDRHKNGDFGSVDALRRVTGIGEWKLKGIVRYF
ncbi:MAG: hypothetical protein FD174_1463 [Geobacteraceae bacterium]|nr:MAG: hypothetical protein FD174_1463 [Geobacteraceae bacterium]